METTIGPQTDQSERRGEQLGIRSWNKQAIGVAFEQDLTRLEIDDLKPNEAAPDGVRAVEYLLNSRRQPGRHQNTGQAGQRA